MNIASRFFAFFVPIVVYCTIFYAFPRPHSLSVSSWQLFAIFSSTIASLITKPMQISSIALVVLAIVTSVNIIPIQQALDGFASPVIWLILIVCFIARSIIKVGLSNRIAYNFMKIFGGSRIGLSYSIILTETLIAPFVLSPTARAGGIIIPVYNSMAKFVTNEKDSSQLKNFLAQVYVQATCITGAMFLTGTSSNPLINKIALEQGIHISWLFWALAASVPAIVSLLILPYSVRRYFPEDFIEKVDFKSLAKDKLVELGPIKKNEWIVILTVVGILLLWIMGAKYCISSISATLIGLSILLLTRILNFDEILAEKEAWNIFIWFSVLVMLSQNLQSCGVITYFSEILRTFVPNQNWYIGLASITLVYFYSHYLFAGALSHVSSMYSVFLSLALGIGAPPVLAALVLAFSSSLFMSITHYAGASTAVIFSNSSIDIPKWWKIGFNISGINLIIWSTIGVIWWKFLGLW